MKTCCRCNKQKDIALFPSNKNKKDGVQPYCKECNRQAARRRTPEQRIKERIKSAKKANKTYIQREERLNMSFNKKSKNIAEQNAKQAWIYFLKHIATDDWIEKYYQSLGKPWSNPRLSRTEKYKIRYNQDEIFQLKERIRRQITKRKKKDGIADVMRLAIKNNNNSNRLERELGYSVEELKNHLERQFIFPMNWKSFLSGDIHIDHIIPQSSFDLTKRDEWVECWSLSNLQPLWARDNLAKRDKILSLL